MDRAESQQVAPTIAANADDYQPSFARVRKGRLNAGAEKVPTSEHKPDEIWLGTIDLDGAEDIPVYVRVAGRRQIMAELICAVFGRSIGLPIPCPYLIHVDKKTLPRSKFWNKERKEAVLFASHAIEDGGTFSQLLVTDSPYAKKLLRTWGQYPETVVFDEWLANVDRNFSNMLFRTNMIWLIDHAEALGGTMSELYPFAEFADTPFHNQLLDAFKDDFTAQHRHGIIQIARDMLRKIKELDMRALLDSIGDEHISATGGPEEMLNFLTNRLDHTLPLLCHRLGMPQLTPISPGPRANVR